MAFTPIDDTDVAFGKITSVEAFSAIANNINYMMSLLPVGTEISVAYGLTGVPVPDSNIWQLCDGSLITNPNSPMRGTNTPDKATLGLYSKGCSSIGVTGTVSGTHAKTLAHTHSVSTAGMSSGPVTVIAANNVTVFGTKYSSDLVSDHVHLIPSDLASTDFEPAHVTVNTYIKIV